MQKSIKPFNSLSNSVKLSVIKDYKHGELLSQGDEVSLFQDRLMLLIFILILGLVRVIMELCMTMSKK